MSKEALTALVADRRHEVLAIVVLLDFGVAFALATTIDAGTTLRASAFLLLFVFAVAIEYVAACRWCEPRVRSLSYWTG